MNKPKKKFQCGAVTLSIWEDYKMIDDEEFSVFSIQIDRAYKEDGEWKHTGYLRVKDLPKAAIVTTEAYKHLKLR